MGQTELVARLFSLEGPLAGLKAWAGVAQLVEHLICNQRVGGSNPFVSSTRQFQSSELSKRWTDLVVLPAGSGAQTSHHSFKAFPGDRKDRSAPEFGALSWLGAALFRRFAADAQVAEWLMAADCKSATQRVTEVRILPCAPHFLVEILAVGSEECNG